MSPELESRIYKSVLRAVLWDESRDEVYHMLEVNGLTGDAADAMFRRARNERIALLRGEGLRKVIEGVVMLAVGGGIFYTFWIGLGAITRSLVVICAGVTAGGLWRLLEGSISALLAAKKKGSVISDD